MSWIEFAITAGTLTQVDDDGTRTLLGPAYSGAPGHVNVAGDVALVAEGPIPLGNWEIGTPFDSPHTGPFSIPLTPAADTETFSRSVFECHGDTPEHNQSASHGCIIAARTIREIVAAFKLLIVVA